MSQFDCALMILRDFFTYRTNVAHRGYALSVAQRQYLFTVDHVYGKPAIADRQRSQSRSPIRIPWIHVHLLVDTNIFTGVVHYVETKTRRLDEELTRRYTIHIDHYYH